MLKWILKGFLVGLVLLVSAAVVLPFVIRVDQYRPEITAAMNQHLEGELSLGKLSLSLWGRIHVDVDGLTLKDSQSKEVLKVQNAYFHLPFTSILGGSPALTLKMKKPQVFLEKSKSGVFNVVGLLKEKKAQAPSKDSSSSASSSSSSSAAPSSSAALPAFASRARLGVELTEAQVSYLDQSTGDQHLLKDLNFVVRDLSLSRPTELEVWGDLDTSLGKKSKLKGPFKITGEFTTALEKGALKKLDIEWGMDLTDLEVQFPELFHKPAGTVAKLKLQGAASPHEFQIATFQANLHNLALNLEGVVSDLSAAEQKLDVKFQSNSVDLASWGGFVPALKASEIEGQVSLKGGASGPVSQLKYFSDVQLVRLSAKGPLFKEKPVLNGTINVVTDQIRHFGVTINAPRNDIKLTGRLVSFARPQFTMLVESQSLDLDTLLNLPPLEKKKQASWFQKAIIQTAHAADPKKTSDLDALFQPLRQSAILRAAQGKAQVSLGMVKAYDVVVKNITTQMRLRDLVAAIENFKFKVWDGSLNQNFSVDFKPSRPTYRMSSSIQGLNLKKAVSSQLQLFKNTVYGTLSFQMSGTGSSFNTDQALKNLNTQGKFTVKDAVFSSIDVGKMVTDAVNKGIEKVAAKYPKIKDKKMKEWEGRESKYEYMTSSFSTRNGLFSAPGFVGKAVRGKGIDIRGNTQVGMLTHKIDAKWKLIDTYNVSKMHDVSVEVAGTRVDHIFAEKGKPVEFPVSVGCKLDAPCYSYKEIPGHFSRVALKNTRGAAKKAVQNKVKTQIKEKIKKDEVKDKAKKLLKGLFR